MVSMLNSGILHLGQAVILFEGLEAAEDKQIDEAIQDSEKRQELLDN